MHQNAVLGWYGIYPAVQAPDGETVPVVAKRKGSEEAYAAGISLAYGGIAHYPEGSVQVSPEPSAEKPVVF